MIESMDNKLTPQEIAAWHRSEAQKHYEMYKIHKDVADAMLSPTMDYLRTLRQEPALPASDLTVEKLNAALKKKQGRVTHVAARLNTIPAVVESLLKDPKSEYGIGERGFIYTKARVAEMAAERAKA
jgi:hypothetical protein